VNPSSVAPLGQLPPSGHITTAVNESETSFVVAGPAKDLTVIPFEIRNWRDRPVGAL
jgi:hypothetical protein